MAKNTPFSDSAKNAFVKTNLFYTDNKFLSMQDPTVLGFKLLFNFDQGDSGLLWGTGNTDVDAPPNTALNYLLSIGDYQRAAYLKQFLYILHGVNNQTPWFWQSIGGLKDLWKQDYNKPLLVDKKIEIECLESIDLRITALMDLYRKACFDWKYRREIVPKNLRQFQMSIYVYEIRYISNPNVVGLADLVNEVKNAAAGFDPQKAKDQFAQKAAQLVGKLAGNDETLNDPNSANVNIVDGVPMSSTRNLFHLNFCEFDMSEATHLDGVNNIGGEPAKQKLIIKYEEYEEDNMYNFWLSDPVSDAWVPSMDASAFDVVPGEPASNITPTFKDLAKDLGQNLIDQGARRLKEIANAKLRALLLGNIYGLSLSNLTGAAAGQNIGRLLKDAGGSLFNDNPRSEAGGNVFDLINSAGSLANDTNDRVRSWDNIKDGSASLANNTRDLSNPRENIGPGSRSLSNNDPENSPNSNIFE